jgi:hypothetical protein
MSAPHPHQSSFLGPTGVGLPGGWLTSPLPFPFVLIAGFGEGGKCAYEGVNPSYSPVLGLLPIPTALAPPDVDLGGGPKLAEPRILPGDDGNPSPIPAPWPANTDGLGETGLEPGGARCEYDEPAKGDCTPCEGGRGAGVPGNPPVCGVLA